MFTVLDILGAGFAVENVHETARAIELRAAGLRFALQWSLTVHDHDAVGDYLPDLLIEAAPLVDPKTVNDPDDAHRMQCPSSLEATGPQVCPPPHFSKPRPDIE